MLRTFFLGLAFSASVVGPLVRAAERPLDTAAIETITGLKGTYNEAEKVFKVSKPRTDIKPNSPLDTLATAFFLLS